MSVFPQTPVTLLKRLARIQQGEDAAEWAEFVQRYSPVLEVFFRLNASMVSAADVEDLVQDTFVRLVGILRREVYDPARGRFRTYLVRLMRNLLIDRWRRDHVLARREGVEALAEIPADVADPGVICDMKLRLAARQAAITHVMEKSQLAEQSKAIYRAVVLEEVPPAEVAARFGVSRNVVSQTKVRVEQMVSAVEASYGI